MSWADRASWALEEKLPELLRELEVRAAEDDHAAAEAERAAEVRQRLWEIEMVEARARFLEHQRAQVLRSQMAAWQEVQALQNYLAAMKEVHREDPGAKEWIDWVEGHLGRLDPLARDQSMPEVPEPSPDDLKPFMQKGVSPYGPSRW